MSTGQTHPIFKTTITRVTKLAWPPGQWSPRCSDFELAMVECFESYGLRMDEKSPCLDYLHDLRECLTEKGSMKRVHVMKKERQTQYEEGRLEKEFLDSPFNNIF